MKTFGEMGLVDWLALFFFGPAVPFTVYVLLQAIALNKLKGVFRIASAAPVFIMSGVLYWTYIGIKLDKPLWFIFLTIMSPFAILILAIVAGTAKIAARKAAKHAPG
jgi:hypothetical protein